MYNHSFVDFQLFLTSNNKSSDFRFLTRFLTGGKATKLRNNNMKVE